MLKVLDLFSGIGGFSLGLGSTGGFETVAFCEIEPFCREVLRKHWPGVPIHDDVRELTAAALGGMRPDAVVGGFPCQDISVAGKGEGIEGARSGLWSEFARLVGELRPRWVLAENVGALRTRGIDQVCSDLEAEGYAVWPLVVGAWAVGAPHKRDRVWIVAYRRGDTLREQPRRGGGTSGADQAEPRGISADLGDTVEPGREERHAAAVAGEAEGRHTAVAAPRWPARPGEPQHEWEEPRLAYGAGERSQRAGPGEVTESKREATCGRRVDNGSARSPEQPLGRHPDGLPERLARRWNRESLKALGNSIVPQVVAVIGRAILEAEEKAK